MSDSTRPPNKPASPPPPKPAPKPAAPTKANADDLLDLADAVGITTPARRSATEGIAAAPSAASATGGPVPITPAVSGRGDGRVAGKGGAATFTLPPTPELSFVFEFDVCGGLDVDQPGPAHCGSGVPHRWHDLLNP